MSRLRCDFHIHTIYSDGWCSVPEILELYAREQFDVIAITDHALDTTSLEVFQQEGGPPSVTRESFSDYMHQLEQFRQRAHEKYNLHLISGLELTNNKDEYHILALDIQEWIDPDLPVPEIINQIHHQQGIAVACHPAKKEGVTEQGSYRHLHENRERYRNLFDTWEIANRYHLFNTISLMKVPYLANSDLHRPEHIFSWKTLLEAEKFDTVSVKNAIRKNDTVALFLHTQSGHQTQRPSRIFIK